MAWAFRASSYANNGAGALVAANGTTTVTLGAAVSAGDMLSLHVTALNTNSGTFPTISVSDSVNGAWSTADVTVTQSVAALGERQSVFSFPNSAAGTPVITITVGNTGTNNVNVGLECAAFSGLATTAPLDVSVVATGTGASPSSGATAATGAANELALGFYGDYGEGDTITKGSTFTLAGEHQSDAGKYEALMEYKDSGASGSTPSAGVTLSATNSGWAMFCVVYKLAAGGGTAPSSSDSGTLANNANQINVSGPSDSAAVTDTANQIGVVPKSTYSSSFPTTENPLSEGGLWLNGKTDGRDWSDFQTSGGKAYGTETGSGAGSAQYDDSTALLKATFSNDQYVRAIAFVTRGAGDYASEVELRLRSRLAIGACSGYEVEYSCDPANPYFDIVRWNGALGDFTPLTLSTGGTHLVTMPGGAVVTGDVLEAYITGSTISAYKNGVLIATATDSTFPSGHPGIGTFIHNRTATGDPSQWGFTSFLARGDGDGVSLAEQNAIALAQQDTAVLAEQVATAAATSTQDSATLAEQIKLALAATESAQLGEAMAIALSRNDTATLQELVSVALAIADAASLSEGASVTQNGGSTPSSNDSATLAESAAIAAPTSTSDIGTLVEQAAIKLGSSDVAAMTEQIGLGLIAADSAALTEQLHVAVASATSDATSLGELQNVVASILAAAESASVTDTARVSQNGVSSTALKILTLPSRSLRFVVAARAFTFTLPKP